MLLLMGENSTLPAMGDITLGDMNSARNTAEVRSAINCMQFFLLTTCSMRDRRAVSSGCHPCKRLCMQTQQVILNAALEERGLT